MSAPFACKGMLPQLASGLFCSWVLLRNSCMVTHLQNSLQVTVAGVFGHPGSETATALLAVSHVVLYYVKRSVSESVAMLPQV